MRKKKQVGHTPGPWEVSGENPDGSYIRTAWEYKKWSRVVIAEIKVIDGPKVGHSVDNANLIAAAPELLEALLLRKALEKAQEENESLSVYDTRWKDLEKMEKAAIKKATGR